jgi:hypothetical protein
MDLFLIPFIALAVYVFNGLAGPWFCDKCWRSVSFTEKDGGEIKECNRCGEQHVTHLAEY